MKKILAFLLCIIAVLSVVACKKPQVEDSDGITVVNNGDRIYATDADQKSLSVIKIGFTEAGFGREWLVEIAKSFIKANDSYEIRLEGDPSLADSMSTKLDSGENLSDIFFPLNSAWEVYASKGQLEPLDDVYASKPDGESGKTVEQKTDENYKTYAKYTTKYGTHYYMLPWNDTVTGIVYNVKMFNEYGWKIPETTDELEELCKKIIADTKDKVKPFAYPGKIGGYFDYIGSTWWIRLLYYW